MDFSLEGINWLSVLAGVVAGQIISTVWFVALFGEPWAKEYGVASRKEHTAQVPGYTYGVQIACNAAQVVGLALLTRWLSIDTAGEAIGLGLFVAVAFCIANGLPGQAFLRRWRVAAIAYGCQSTMIVAATLILALWR